MKRTANRIVKTVTLALLIVSIFICNIMPVLALSKEEKTMADICVIYDNSASTYEDETWCRYKYVLEVMATLIDYDSGSRLFIYPLCTVTLDGRESSASCEPIKISSYADIGKINNMFTVSPAGTPFEPVMNAYDYLTNVSSANDKRLFILTDGMFTDFESNAELEYCLQNMVKDSSVKIHYFGSGEAVRIPSDESSGLYSYYMTGLVDTQDLLDFAISLCCDLFSQSKVVSSKSQLTKVNLKTKGRVIVFASGKESIVLGLKDNNDIAIPFLYDTGRHRYSTTKATDFVNAPIDTNLDCYISIFECEDSGEYTLACKNVELVDIYIQDNTMNSQVVGEIKNQNNEIDVSTEFKFVVLFLLLVLIAVIGVVLSRKSQKSKKKYQIFISYRRDGGDILAGRLADRFTNMGYKTFFDIESMRSGEFNEQIYKAIDECQDVLLVLPPDALDRCVNESDWVRKEIEYAMKKQKNIIPILMNGFEFPDNLPDEIDNIRNYEGVTASKEYFDAVIDKIESYLDCKKKKFKNR